MGDVREARLQTYIFIVLSLVCNSTVSCDNVALLKPLDTASTTSREPERSGNVLHSCYWQITEYTYVPPEWHAIYFSMIVVRYVLILERGEDG